MKRAVQPAFSNPPLHAADLSTLHEQTWANHITSWIESVPESSPDCELFDISAANSTLVPDPMSDGLRRRELRRGRSCSPTKKSEQYRSTVLRPNNIFVDTTHNLPPEIQALLPCGLRHILDHDFPPPPTNIPADINNKVGELALVYRDECRELSKRPGTGPEYRGHLFTDVVEKLARILLWRETLSASCSDKLWLASLKPPAASPVLSSKWPSLAPNFTAAKLPQNAPFESRQSSSNSAIPRVRPDSQAFNCTAPPTSTEPSDSSTSTELDGTITTPKPDITIGISREAFGVDHRRLLDYLQTTGIVFSDPHTSQGSMRFPIIIIETKGLTTNGNLTGAQNQAAGAGTCALRLLESLTAQDPSAGAPRIVFSITTEGAIHELWIHYQMSDEENVSKYHMTCLGIWRVTFDRHAKEFVAALASLLHWGVEVFHPQIKQSLDRVLHKANDNP